MKLLSSILTLGLFAFASAALAGSPPVAPAPHGAAHRPHHGHHHGHRHGWGLPGGIFAGPVVLPTVEQAAPVAPPAVAPAPPRPQVIVIVHERPRCFEPKIIVLKRRAETPGPRVHYGQPKGC